MNLRSKSLDMLQRNLDVIVEIEELYPQDAFQRLLDYTAYRLGVKDAVAAFNNKTFDHLNKNFKMDMLHFQTWDWFGELYERIYQPSVPLSHKKSLDKHVHATIQMIEANHDNFPSTILDRHIGTGRLILLVHSAIPRDVLYYGVEHSLLPYQICLVNMKLFNIPAKILYHSDNRPIDIRSGSSNWLKANWWKPYTADKLNR